MKAYYALIVGMSLGLLGACTDISDSSHVNGAASFVSNARACKITLAPHAGATQSDLDIIHRQQQIKQVADPVPYLERLGWAYISKARESFDPGFYRLAEQSALCMVSINGNSHEALLLRGHVLHNLHEFKQAETLARQLVAQRKLWFDYGLLGDVLMEQGKLDAAVQAYQAMMDQRPGPQAYSRAAHVRWLMGDLAGAIEAMEMTSQSSDPRAPESAAWAYVRLAGYRLQQADYQRAAELINSALRLQPNYPPALVAQGRLQLALDNGERALSAFTAAYQLNPQPEYQWALIDTLNLLARQPEASLIEVQLLQTGSNEDPRTLALYLASTAQQTDKALQLATRELVKREDIFTLDAMAWALYANGQVDKAYHYMQRALIHGTNDARLFYHAALICVAAGEPEQAQGWFKKAMVLQHMLLHSEQAKLMQAEHSAANSYATSF